MLARLQIKLESDEVMSYNKSVILQSIIMNRNLAAHDIVGVSDEWIEKSCGFNSEKIMNNMYKLAQYAGVVFGEDNKNGYSIMNDDLIAMLWISIRENINKWDCYLNKECFHGSTAMIFMMKWEIIDTEKAQGVNGDERGKLGD